MSPPAHPMLESEVKRRRTFAIISHPDAGKTTLTEKLLLYGGAIHLAGSVKAKKNQRNTTSDWMEIEKQRGISISASVLQFDYNGTQINLLDTPGHKDFSEDTYRTLTAADAAVMLIDGAKGVEGQTRKLFEVCRMRGIPIFTFVNKMDRPGREPLDLIDELESVLGIRSCPMTWPIGMGDRFRGVYDRQKENILFYDELDQANATKKLGEKRVSHLPEDEFIALLGGPKKDLYEGKELYDQLQAELELLEVAGDEFDQERVLNGNLSPVFFGSAMNNFGVEAFLQSFIDIAPAPTVRKSSIGEVEPTHEDFSGFVFKIQANMDPQHRDRVAYLRICSGRFERNINAKHSRLKKNYKVAMPVHFFGQERVIVEEAWPGDIIGIMDTSGSLRIGDTLSSGKALKYEEVPSFSPEHFAMVTIKDPMKRKQLQKGLDQLSEEGVIQIYRQIGLGDKDPYLGAVGALQFEVLKHRLQMEYSVDVSIQIQPFSHARWVISRDGGKVDSRFFDQREDSRCVLDRDENLVLLFKSEWAMNWARDNNSSVDFVSTAPINTFA